MGEPICEECITEISHLLEEYEKPDDFVLYRLVALTSLSIPEYKRISIEEFVEYFENRLKPENVSDSRRPRWFFGIPPSYLHSHIVFISPGIVFF